MLCHSANEWSAICLRPGEARLSCKVHVTSLFRPVLTVILFYISIYQSSGNLLLPQPGKLVAVLVIWVNRGMGKKQGGADACSPLLH